MYKIQNYEMHWNYRSHTKRGTRWCLTVQIIVISSGTDDENQNSSQSVTIGQINQKIEASSSYNLMCTLFGSLTGIVLLIMAILAKHHFDR